MFEECGACDPMKSERKKQARSKQDKFFGRRGGAGKSRFRAYAMRARNSAFVLYFLIAPFSVSIASTDLMSTISRRSL